MMKLFKNFSMRDLYIILVCIALIVFQVWLDLKLPDYMSKITVLVRNSGNSISEVLKQGGFMMLCALGSLAAAIIVGYLSSLLSATFSMNVRKKIYKKVESFSEEEMRKFETSSLITRTTNDITNIQMLISMGLQMLIKAPITAVWAVLKILGKGWQWSIITGIAVSVLILMITILMILVFPNFKIVQKLIDNINNITRENLTGIRVVRAFNAEQYQEKKFEKGNNILTRTQLFNQRMMSIMSPIMYLIMNMLTLSIYFVGAHMIDGASMVNKMEIFSNMVVFTSYAMQVIMSFLMLAMIFIMLPRASVSAARINEVLETDERIKSGKFKEETKVKGKIEFKNVSFKYPDSDEYVLKDISFVANSGDTVAFIGSTGSGKSTLVNLIMRFYDVTEGEILIDDINVKEYDLEELYKKLGYVPQKAVIFDGDINTNISYGSNQKDDNKIREASRIAQAEDFIEKLEEKYESHLARSGTNVSGGQKQRISIARAIYKNPEIYIFDDSFSALDYKTDYLLRRDLKEYTSNSTNLIVAQRIGTILNSDLIIVLDSGECVGSGTHDYLLNNCEVYKEIAYSQLSEEELKHE